MEDPRDGTWKKRIEYVMATQQDAWENIEYATPSITKRESTTINKPDKYVDADFYIEEDQDAYDHPFLVYTKRWIYFAILYDGTNWVGSVPRHPMRRFAPEMFGSG